MTEAEIIRALECCQEPRTSCKDMGCPFYKYCLADIDALTKHSLDLIKRQKAEIEEWKLEQCRILHRCSEQIIEAREEARKEFADGVRKLFINAPMQGGSFLIKYEDADSFLKEMEGA